MTNTQLWAVNPQGTKIKLDLYETEPIKLTFTAENLTDLPAINSTYSQTFRVPATSINNQFFKFYFNPNSNDYDVSIKVTAEILTEAGFFIEGQIRLQKVYRNYESTLVDYEILFLGEVRDFSTQVGEGFMNTIYCGGLAHTLNYANITNSWNALAGTTNGLKQGNVIYPLVEYGYTYNTAGVVQQNQLATSGNRRFTQSQHALDLWQWRPWVRAKFLIDQIFATTDYTYNSLFFESDLFQNLYVNATGNIATPTTLDLVSTNQMQVVAGDQEYGTISGVPQIWSWPQETFDSGNNWQTNVYTAPITGPYNFNYNLDGQVTWVNIGGGTGAWPFVLIDIFYRKNAVETIIATADNGGLDPAVYFNELGSLNLNLVAGDQIDFGYRVTRTGNTVTYLFETELNGNALTVTAAPVSVNPGPLLSNKIKKIDWFKSILKRFRMVMVPNSDNPREFIIEPWEDYIQSGQSLDWTHKLDGSKDILFEPLFFTQSATIKLTDQEDADHPNDNHQRVFKEVYGTKIYDSNNDLLKDERLIQTVMAPTPVERVEGTLASNIIIPHMALLDAADGATTGKLKPIVAKPRLLFWNGLKPNGFTGNNHWYMYNDFTQPQTMNDYPMVSYMSEFPSTPNTLNLSFELEFPRFIEPPTATLGTDVFTRYWEGYIESTYSKEARKCTATFILDAQDLKVQFNDSIFIRDSWWRILKIIDAPLTGYNPVKVELIKLLDSPDAQCDCTQYFVTDSRSIPEAPLVFTYIDCITGQPVSGQVFMNSVAVCACKPFTTGNPLVFVTTTNTGCNTSPGTPVPVVVSALRGANAPGGAIILQRSSTGVGDGWQEVYSQDLPIGATNLQLEVEVTSGDFLRLGYVQSGVNSATISWLRDEQLVNQQTFEASPDLIFVTLEEQTYAGDVYTTSLVVT